MSSAYNHTARSSRINHFNKVNFNSMVRRKKARDWYYQFGTPVMRYGKNGIRIDEDATPAELKDEPMEEIPNED